MVSTPGQDANWELAHVLGESTRRRVFEAVRAAGVPVSRDEVAARTQINRRLAAFHLDRLATSGLVEVDYARPEGRTPGPGAGRPAKRYSATPVQLNLSLPQRSYDLAARVLAAGIATHPDDARTGALEAARREGEKLGRSHLNQSNSVPARISRLRDGLSTVGYEPRVDSTCVRLGNCPFRSAADVAGDLVCTMNREFVAGFVDGSQARPADVVLEPQVPPNCCVTITVRPP